MAEGRNRRATDGASSSPPTTYGVEVIARVLGITSRRVQQLAREGVFPQVGRGKYPLVACVQAYIKYWQDRAEGRVRGAVTDDLGAARARKTAAEAELAELELARARGEVIPLSVHEERVERIASHLAAICKGGLGRWRAEIQQATTPLEVDLVLEHMTDGLLDALRGVADGLEAEAHGDGDRPAA